MAQLGHKNHLCAWSCAGFGNKDKHDQTARTRLRKLHRFNMFDRKLNMYSLVLHGKKWLRCTRYINASCPMYGATTAIGASYFHLHVLCWIRACMFFFHFYLTLGFLFNLCLCDFDLPASKDGATDNFLFQTMQSARSLSILSIARQMVLTNSTPILKSRTVLICIRDDRTDRTAGEKEGKHGAESTPQISLNLSNTICACG